MVSFKEYVESLDESLDFLDNQIKKPNRFTPKGLRKRRERAIGAIVDKMDHFKKKYQNKIYEYLDKFKSDKHRTDVAKASEKLKKVIAELEYRLTWETDEGSLADVKNKVIALDGRQVQQYDPNFLQKKYLKMMVTLAHEVGHAIQHHDPKESYRMSQFIEGWYAHKLYMDVEDRGDVSEHLFLQLLDEFDMGATIWKELDAWELGSRFIPEKLMPYFMRSAAYYLTGYLNEYDEILPELIDFDSNVLRLIRKFAPNYDL